MSQCCVLTRGEFYITDWKSDCVGGIPDLNCSGMTAPFRKVGNVSSALVNISTSIVGKENKFNPMKDACSRVLIEGITLDITFTCASKENLYRALFSEEQTDFPNVDTKDFCIHELLEGDFFPFNKYGAESITVVLKDGDTVIKTLIEDDDYRVTKSGVELLKDIDKESATTLRLSYSYDPATYHIFEFLSKYIGYKTIYFKGTNFNDDRNDLFDCEFHKVLFTPINQFDLISRDEFFTISLSGSVELDKTQNSWFRLIKQET